MMKKGKKVTYDMGKILKTNRDTSTLPFSSANLAKLLNQKNITV